MKHACELPVGTDVRIGDIPGSVDTFDISTLGAGVAGFFENYPDTPGAIITNEGKFVCAITQNEFLRAIGRQFGSDLFYRRPIQALISFLNSNPMLVLPHDCTIHEAMDRCLARDKHAMFDSFLVEHKSTGAIKMVDFRTLTLVSSSVLESRNNQLAKEISERKILEQKLLRAQRMETVGLLAGGVAHNLNNTLSPILMASSMLVAGIPETTQGEFVQIIVDSAKRAAGIVQELLSFSSGLAAKQSTFAPQVLIEEVEKFTRMSFPTSITITTRLGNALYNITGDQARLHQVLLNLCINSKHAMPNSGEIILAVENSDIEENSELLPTGVVPGRFIKFSVSDSGCGIAPESIEKVFDPFFTTKEVGKGTGLGLSTALGIVRSHGGFIKVASKLGKGSTFSVFLPASARPADNGVSEPSRGAPQGRGELILIADDEVHIRKLAESILTENGYKVVTARNGYEAFSAYGNQGRKIEVVLTDITMPVMNGVELARLLKKKNPKAKIIVSSGKIDRTDEFALTSFGVNERLLKPYRADQLLKVIHDNIHGKVPELACQALSS